MNLPVGKASRAYPKLALALLMGAALLLAGCGKHKATTTTFAPSVSMSFPSSMTGTASTSTSLNLKPLATSQPTCAYAGAGETDPLRNGFMMTRWLVGNTAGWMCITDFLAKTVSTLVTGGAIPTDGTFVDLSSSSSGTGNPPTGISVLASGGQTTLQLYFHGNTTAPGVWLSWTGSGSTYAGRLIVYTADLENDPSTDSTVDAASPTHMRLDFNFSDTQKAANMYMAFSPNGYTTPSSWNNPWMNGFRVDATETLADNSFVIKGYMSTKAHLDTNYATLTGDTTTTPAVQLLAVSDSSGNGAAVANATDIALAFTFDASDHLGYFLYTKNDRYYFNSAGAADWIKKNVTAATYKTVSGWTNTTPSDTDIDNYLISKGASISSGTTAGCKTNTGTDCPDLLNAIFDTGAYGADTDSSVAEPTDSRRTALDSATYLTQAQPDGYTATDWSGVFDRTYP